MLGKLVSNVTYRLLLKLFRKSQVAIEFCYRYRDLHPNQHIFWVYAGTRERFAQAYKDIARRLELPGWNDPAMDTLLLVSEWFNNNENWLMVLDNADDLETFFPKPASNIGDVEHKKPLLDYLPQNSRGLVLITTRDKRIGERLASRHASLIVPLMTVSEAKELLRSQLEQSDSWNDEDIESLLDVLKYLPLAITQAAAFLRQYSCSLNQYLEMFQTNDSEIQGLLDEDLGDMRRDSEKQNSVIKTWKLSFDLISKQKPRAAEILSIMAVLDRQGMPRNLFKNDTDRDVDVIMAIGTLQAFSLIREVDGVGYQLHRLVQLATRKWLEIEGTKEKWQEQAFLAIAKEFPLGVFKNWTTCEVLLPHAETVIQYSHVIKLYPEQYSNLLFNMATFDWGQERYEIAYTRLNDVFEMRKEIFGLEHSITLKSMNSLAISCLSLDRWDEAEKLQTQVLETRLKVLKAEHPDTLTSMQNLAWIYLVQNQCDEAEKLLTQVLKMRLKVLKAEHPDTLTSMNILAFTYQKQNRWDEAEKLFTQVTGTGLKVLNCGTSSHAVQHARFSIYVSKSVENLAEILD